MQGQDDTSHHRRVPVPNLAQATQPQSHHARPCQTRRFPHYNVSMLLAWLAPIAPTASEITLDLPAPPDPLGPLVGLIGGLGILLVATALLRRLLGGRRGAKTLFAFSLGVGNALMEVGAMLQPDRPQVTVASEKDSPCASESASESESDGEHDPPPADGTRPDISSRSTRRLLPPTVFRPRS